MKLKLYIIIGASFFAVAALVVSCDKEIELTEQLTPLKPVNLDVAAENWSSIDPSINLTTIETSAETSSPKIFDPTNDAVGVADVTTAAYKAELATIKDLQSKLTAEQRKIIAYWGAGGVLRWNQILRDLVARYNLPPTPNPDGSYSVPDSENPFANPGFPFSNPPYASRAYSYVSVAQYEALKAAWHYMYLYNRPSPYKNDSGIKSLMPETTLPSYPSYDAVLSGVSAEVLKLLFPAALEEITRKAGEQRNAALWSGKASSSDIAKGLALGKAVATLFTNRAKADRMGNAGGNKALWTALADTATAHGEIPWKSLEVPARPPQLPFFGLRKVGVSTGVKTWIMTDQQITNDRPKRPFSTSSDSMKIEVNEVKYYSKHLSNKNLAIVQKWADGAGTYTPPGHWNDIATEYLRDAKFSEVRTARAYALLNVAIHDAAIACWDTKYFYFNPRPSQMDSEIKTGTGIPNFPSYTSGHSTFSGASAAVLGYLFPDGATFFDSQATEASMSRLYGAIHYRSDCSMGLKHGKKVGGHVITFAQNDGADSSQ